MGVIRTSVATPAPQTRCESAVRKLFPQGDYWDRQFADPESDVSLFCEAKADYIVRLKNRAFDLRAESVIQTATETLDDWERVLRGVATIGLDIKTRRALLAASRTESITVEAIKKIGAAYGVSITRVTLPFRPGFFGHSRFGVDRISSPAAFSVLFVYASQPDETTREEFESQMAASILSNYIVYFIYGGS